MHNLKLVIGFGGDMVFLLNSGSPAVALAPPKAHGPRVAGRWCLTTGLSPVTGRGQNSQGYGKFLEAGVIRLYKPGTALAQGGSYTRDTHRTYISPLTIFVAGFLKLAIKANARKD